MVGGGRVTGAVNARPSSFGRDLAHSVDSMIVLRSEVGVSYKSPGKRREQAQLGNASAALNKPHEMSPQAQLYMETLVWFLQGSVLSLGTTIYYPPRHYVGVSRQGGLHSLHPPSADSKPPSADSHHSEDSVAGPGLTDFGANAKHLSCL